MRCPQQTNGYDCGVFVLLITETLRNFIHSVEMHPDIKPETFVELVASLLEKEVLPDVVMEYRKRLKVQLVSDSVLFLQDKR